MSKYSRNTKGRLSRVSSCGLRAPTSPYRDVKVPRGFATFAFVCFDSQTERDTALGMMTASINLKSGNAWDEWEIQENRPKRPSRPEQTPVERLMYQARDKVMDSDIGKQSNVRINMNWSYRSLHAADMQTCQNTLLGNAATTKIWEWTTQAAGMLATSLMMMLEERPVRQTRERRDLPVEE